MPMHVRTGSTGQKFAKLYKDVENFLKVNKKILDSKHKRICQEILDEGEKFWGKVEAKSRKEYDDMIEDYYKKNDKEFKKLEKHIEDLTDKAG